MNPIETRELEIENVLWPTAGRVARRPQQSRRSQSIDRTPRDPVLVVGCSEQLPHQPRAYHLVSVSPGGQALLSRHDGTSYTGNMSELSSYRGALASMIGSVLESMPPILRARARTALLKRWNREWDVSALAVSCALCQREGHLDMMADTIVA